MDYFDNQLFVYLVNDSTLDDLALLSLTKTSITTLRTPENFYFACDRLLESTEFKLVRPPINESVAGE